MKTGWIDQKLVQPKFWLLFVYFMSLLDHMLLICTMDTILKLKSEKYDAAKHFEKPETLGDELIRCRKRLGLSRTELSKRSGIAANSISKYEQAGRVGGQYPPIPKLAKLCVELGIDARELLAMTLEDNQDAITLLETGGSRDDYENLMGELTEFAENPQKPMVLFDRNNNMFSVTHIPMQQHLANPWDKTAKLKEPAEASLATSSTGSNPKSTPIAKKEPEDGQSSD